MKKVTFKIDDYKALLESKPFNRDYWLEHDCVPVHMNGCAMCPYVIYDDNGHKKCEREMFEECGMMDDYNYGYSND